MKKLPPLVVSACLALAGMAIVAAAREPLAWADSRREAEYDIDFGKDDQERERHIDVSKFPQVSVRFRILDKQTRRPAQNLPDADVVIYEDGVEVARQRVKGGGPVSAMLVMDTSGSMAPDRKVDPANPPSTSKIERAKEAAGDFFDRLSRDILCGLVLFSHKVYEIQPPTPDRSRPRQAIAAARAEGGTAYFDAAAEAVHRLANETGRKAVVLLTDGRDTNSKKYDLNKVIQLARQQGVQFYTVGLGKPGRNYPVRLILVLDCSGSMLERSGGVTKFDRMKEASLGFIEFLRKDQIELGGGERLTVDAAQMAIIPFSSSVAKAEPLTNKEAELRRVIARLTARGDTALYDATCEAILTLDAATFRDKARFEERGKGVSRSVIVLTDGKDTSSGRNPEHILNLHKQTGIKVYMLGLGDPRFLQEEVMRKISESCGGEYFPVPDSAALSRVFEDLSIQLNDDGIDEESLQRLAHETGGQYFHVENADKLAEQFSSIAGALETYSIEYQSRRPRKDGLGRSIRIKFGDYAEARTGFGLHGMLTPAYDSLVYLLFLLLLGGLLAAPFAVRRFGSRHNGVSE